jgi:hypothetical protein
MFMKRALKVLIIGIIVFALATVTYAFAAANTVNNSNAGDGSGTISGYNITAIAYTLDGSNPANITKLTFTLTPIGGGSDASVVWVSLTGATPYTSCTVSGTTATCLWSGAGEPTVLSATSLRVIATQ